MIRMTHAISFSRSGCHGTYQARDWCGTNQYVVFRKHDRMTGHTHKIATAANTKTQVAAGIVSFFMYPLQRQFGRKMEVMHSAAYVRALDLVLVYRMRVSNSTTLFTNSFNGARLIQQY